MANAHHADTALAFDKHQLLSLARSCHWYGGVGDSVVSAWRRSEGRGGLDGWVWPERLYPEIRGTG